MILIIGGGIIGLCIAWRLALSGRPVTVIERDQAGRGSTWAAAGMLAPYAEVERQEHELLQLLIAGRDMWPTFAAELEAASGVDIDYRTEGALLVALDRDDAAGLRFRYDLMRDFKLPVEWLSGAEARHMEPHLARGIVAAISSADDHQVDNRRVVEALILALERAGGTLLENREVVGIEQERGRVVGLQLRHREGSGDTQVMRAEAVVIAAGAWSHDIPGLPASVRPAVRPVKGQVLSLAMDPAAPLMGRMIWGPGCYLVPRTDGRLLLGTTVEEMGFDTRLTAGGMLDILREAWETVPGIYDLPVVETLAGLRPTSLDDAPILGKTKVPGLIMATGHHRNGILLAPLTADVVTETLTSGRMPDIAKPFEPGRFEL